MSKEGSGSRLACASLIWEAKPGLPALVQNRDPPWSGKWPMGPGWPVTRGATSGPRRRVGTQGAGGRSTPPETLSGPLPPSGPPAASVFLSTPPRSPLLSHPTGAPRADASGDPGTRYL